MTLSALNNDAWLSTEISSRETHLRYRTKVDVGSTYGIAEVTQQLRQFKDSIFLIGSYHSGTEKNLKSYLKSNHRSVIYNKLKVLISTENICADLDSLTVTAETALEAVMEFGPTIIPANDLYGIQIHGEQLATLLRATYSWRGEIPGWNNALRVARSKLAEQGIDPDDALYGMI
ncbi:hypothetical protein [Pseudomonas syringae]|uniref:hypothetical protein n=1 Tax=Pseudomonas syringae TaxID=317 RepID=UPI0023F9F584|nr:hypothetical protein [Pseudomonas syringae]MDF5776545.1 hypothetical protein [Pseudomonas syringae pv. syringae]